MRTDVLLDASDDLLFKNNDLVLGASDQQHIQDTINASPLSWKQFPTEGVAILLYLNSSGQTQQLQGAIRQQLAIDGYKANPIITRVNDNYTINPNVSNI
jgi:hypothetical protein